MRRLNHFALLLLAGTFGQAHAQSLRSGGCSDLYGTSPAQQVETVSATEKSSRVHLISTNLSAGGAVHPVGLFRKGGCSHGGCAAPMQFGAPAAAYYQAPVANYYTAPAVQYYQGPAHQNSGAPSSAGCTSCGNAVVAYGNTIQSNAGGYGAVVVPTEQRTLIDIGPINSYKVVLEPKYFTETQAVCTTEYQNETRYRTRVVARTVPVETQDYKTITVMVPRSETKSVEYSVLVPQTSEKTVEVVDTVPVWTEVAEQYTVKVPTVVDVPEEYKVRVPQLVDQEFTYTVQVPQTLTEMRLQSVTNAIPVTKTRTVQTCQPVTRMQTVTKDYGHWEDRVEEVVVAAPAVSYDAGAYAAPAACAAPAVYAAPAPAYSGGNGVGCGSGHAGRCGCGLGGGRHHGCGLFRRGGCGASAASCGTGCGSGSCGSVAGGCGVSGYSSAACGVSQPAYAASAACGPAQGSICYSAPAQSTGPVTQTISRRVWVPNVVTEEVAVVENVTQSQEVAYTVFEQKTEQVPFEATYLVYRPETRTGTRKVVNYVEEARTRTRKVVEYKDETRTRTRKQLSYKQETRTETIPVVSYTTEKRTKDVTYTFNVPETKVEPFTSTRFETVNEEVSEEYTVTVPVATVKEVQVQVCRMVPKLVPVTIYPSAVGSQACASGCSDCGSAPATHAPVAGGAGCSGCAGGCTGCK